MFFQHSVQGHVYPRVFDVMAKALVFRDRDRLPTLTSARAASITFLAGAGLLIILMCGQPMMDTVSWWDKSFQPTVIATCFSLMVFGLIFGGGPVYFFSNAILRFFARISYSLYLVHLPLVPMAMVFAKAFGNGDANFQSFFPNFVVLSIMTCLATKP
jgi:peptidoglycan/LPS O-acetylase OafA/YrhL